MSNNNEVIRNIDDKDIEGAGDEAEDLASLSNIIYLFTAWKNMMTPRKGVPYRRHQYQRKFLNQSKQHLWCTKSCKT